MLLAVIHIFPYFEFCFILLSETKYILEISLTVYFFALNIFIGFSCLTNI